MVIGHLLVIGAWDLSGKRDGAEKETKERKKGRAEKGRKKGRRGGKRDEVPFHEPPRGRRHLAATFARPDFPSHGRVSLTPEGRKALTRLRAIVTRVDDEFLAPLDADERATLHQLLLKLAAAHDERYAPNGSA